MKTRVFISVELPDEVRKNMTELINELKGAGASIKWVEEKNLHITLKFLGWVEDGKVDNVVELVSKAVGGTGSFKAKFEGIGTFPRVVWVGVKEGGEELKKLANSLEETLSSAGYRSEERGFNSHVTIGRIKEKKAPRLVSIGSGLARGKGVDKLKEKMDGFKDAKFGEVWVNSISIMKSTLTPKGPIYEKIKEVKL